MWVLHGKCKDDVSFITLQAQKILQESKMLPKYQPKRGGDLG
jgi:hypothetical protein